MDNSILKRRTLREIVNDNKTKQILASMKLPDNCKCLEIGAGTGSIAYYLATLFPRGEVHAVDLNPQNIQQIIRRFPEQTNLKAFVSDVFKLDGLDVQYDLIHARFLLEHLLDWSDLVSHLCEIKLKPGGIIFLEDAVYSQKLGYDEGDYEHVMLAYSNAISDNSEKWNCALKTASFLGSCGLIDIQSFGEIQTYSGNTIDSEYWKCCFIENKTQLYNQGVKEEELYSVIRKLDCKDKWFSGPMVFHTYGRKKDDVVLKQQDNYSPIRLVLTDCDGCLTDSGMYYSEDGNELKKFNTRDGIGFALLREKDIMTGIITGENVKLIQRRAEKMKVDILEMGCKDKLSVVRTICQKCGIPLENVAFIGDDLNDFDLLSAVGLSCCPADAAEHIKTVVNYIAKAKGGEGVLREVAELILKINDSEN